MSDDCQLKIEIDVKEEAIDVPRASPSKNDDDENSRQSVSCPKFKKAYAVPKPKDGPKQPAASLYQRSMVIRNAGSKYPTEIFDGVNLEKIGDRAVMDGDSPTQSCT